MHFTVINDMELRLDISILKNINSNVKQGQYNAKKKKLTDIIHAGIAYHISYKKCRRDVYIAPDKRG